MSNEEMQPTFLSLDKEIVLRALRVAEESKDWSSELLAAHDASLGRTTRKNESWARILEAGIRNAERTVNELRELV